MGKRVVNPSRARSLNQRQSTEPGVCENAVLIQIGLKG